MRMLRAPSTELQNTSPTKSKRRLRSKGPTEFLPSNGSPSDSALLNSQLTQNVQCLSQDMAAFSGNVSVSPRPTIELDQLNQRQLLLQALVASSAANNIPSRRSPSPASSLTSSNASSSQAYLLESFNENNVNDHST